MQRLQGDGLVFAHAGGMVHGIDLAPGDQLRVDTGCLVALQPSVNYDIQFVGKIKTALFGGEGIFFATLTGPGRVWLQSLPLSRLADRIYKAAPQTGGSRVGEGSILDHAFRLGNVIDGD
ncbi:MAG TPA: AIM24 family protein, partial [Vicinamibacteria bacterium]|nr:AIM24 family protein [Vicinamibacteria bacterium]